MATQAPPSVAPSGEEAIHRTVDVEPVPLASGQGGALALEQAYEVDLTLAEIERGNYHRIGLQFADEQLHDAVQVYRALRDRLPKEKELYVLADTTYGSCCVDEVAAQHVDADFVVHYGHTCLSPTARLPVLYVLTKREIDTEHAASSVASTSRASLDEEPPKAIIVLYDVAYAHKSHLVADALRSHLPTSIPVVLSHLDKRANLRSHAPRPAPPPSDSGEAEGLNGGKGKAPARAAEVVAAADREETQSLADGQTPSRTSAEALPHQSRDDDEDAATQSEPLGFDPEPSVPEPPTTVPKSSARYDLPAGVDSVDDCALVWIGGESLALNNVLLTHGRCRVWSYDPATRSSRLESGRTNRMLMRRYATVEKAKDADVIGILVGTLGVAAYLPLITHLRQLIASHQKKSYTVAVGKLNPAKLANFIEVECFVLVACPENSMVDSKEFLRPIVTPFELELALTSKAWTGDYILDFAQLLESSTFGQDAGTLAADEREHRGEDDGEDGEDQDEDAPVFSSATGQYRHPKKYVQRGFKDADELASQATALAIRDQSSAVARVLGSAAGEYMAGRTYKGLEPRYGMDAPAQLEMGREGGIARGYGYERTDAESKQSGEIGRAHV